MSARYSDSGMTKEVPVKYDIQYNGGDLFEPGENGGVSGFYEEIVNSVVGMNL